MLQTETPLNTCNNLGPGTKEPNFAPQHPMFVKLKLGSDDESLPVAATSKAKVE